MFYSPPVQKYLHECIARCPVRGLVVNVNETPDGLVLHLYRENYDSIPDQGREDVLFWLQRTLTGINDMGCPITLEMNGYVNAL